MVIRISRQLLLCLVICLLIAAKSFALDKKESYVLSHYIMAVMYDDLGDLDKAIEEYKKALKVENKNTVIHLNLAVSYIKKNEFVKASDELDLTIKLDPEAVEPHAIKALLYSLQNKVGEANREYEIALKNASKLNPKDIEVYKSLGLLYLQQKKLQAAESIYKLVLNMAPGDAESHFYLANIYDQSGNKKQAEKELKNSLEIKPDYHEALNYLGYLYVEENRNLNDAERMINRAIELQPDNGAYIDSLGWLHFKKGKYKEALELLKKASGLLEDPVIYDHLGDAYQKTGDMENAKINWQNSFKLDSKQENIKKKIEDADKRLKIKSDKPASAVSPRGEPAGGKNQDSK